MTARLSMDGAIAGFAALRTDGAAQARIARFLERKRPGRPREDTP